MSKKKKPTSTLLRSRDGNSCHYCGCRTNKIHGDAKQGTTEHIVPRFLGGKNSIENYVLACSECNVSRGTLIFFCRCNRCTTLINAALKDSVLISKVFMGMIKYNTPRVIKRDNHWLSIVGGNTSSHNTWNSAMLHATGSVAV